MDFPAAAFRMFGQELSITQSFHNFFSIVLEVFLEDLM